MTGRDGKVDREGGRKREKERLLYLPVKYTRDRSPK